MEKIILASESERRIRLLKKAGLKFSVIPSRIDETCFRSFPCEQRAILLALKKASTIARGLKRGVIIGADTMVVHNGRIFGKPENFTHAKKILHTLSDSTHYVYTAIALIDVLSKRIIVDLEKTKVVTRKIPSSLIEKLAGKNLDKAGAYAVQQDADLIVKKIEGDYYNVVGLPLKKLGEALRHFPVNLSKVRFG